MAVETPPPNFDVAHLGFIKEQKDRLSEALLSGRAESFEEYKWMVGQYRGLCVAENNFKELLQSCENR